MDIVKEVMDTTNGEGVKCVIDGIGLSTWEISLNSLVSIQPLPPLSSRPKPRYYARSLPCCAPPSSL